MTDRSIIIIFGASGTGKTTLIKELDLSGKYYSVHIKETDRQRREYDDHEIKCIENFDPKNYDYVYQTYGHRYGISKNQINDALEKGTRHLIICNDISTIKKIKKDFEIYVKVIFYYFDAPEIELINIQKTRQIGDDEIQLRLAKTSILYKQFVENYELFDGAISASFGEPIVNIISKVEDIMQNDGKERATKSILLKVEKVIDGMDRSYNSDTYNKNYAFVIMPIRENDPENDDVYDTIVRTCNELSIKAERIDKIQFTGRITEKIQGSIKLSHFLIADITHERPNVYYEIGYADALNKPIILISKHGVKPHFDIEGNNIKFYHGMKHLHDNLKEMVIDIVKKQ